MSTVDLLIAAGVALLAGGINSIAGGGSLVLFPTLVALGMGESLITVLRRRRILIDSPRMQIRDDREAAQPR